MSKPERVVEVAGIRLRPFQLRDLPSLERWLQPEQEWQLWDAPYFPKSPPAAVAAHVARLRSRICRAEPEPDEFAIVDDQDVLVGRAAWHWEHEASSWARCGLTVYDPAVRGKGIGAQALRMLTDDVFGSSTAHRLDFVTWSGNIAMCRVGEKLGWTKEATFREAREVRGIRYDSVVYGVLRAEWLSAGVP